MYAQPNLVLDWPSTADSDERVLQLLSAEHPAAAPALLERFGQRVYQLSRRILSSDEDAKDAMLETFLTVLKQWPTFRHQARFSSWIYRIAHNQACMMRRQRRRHDATVSLEQAVPSAHLQPHHETPYLDLLGEDEQTPSRMLEQSELRHHLDRAIASLPAPYRQVYHLKEVEGLSLREVSAITRLSEPAIKTRLHRARQQLRRKLAHIAP
jgi:RNA polymerase sigma-70 factor (ECF subfamily)